MAIKILLAPFTSNNPYQERLVSGLVENGALVDTSATNRILPLLLSSYNVLHLHWLHPFYRGGYNATRLIRLSGFMLSLLSARLTGCAIVWTVHNIRSHETDFPKLDAIITKLVVQMADGFIVHCVWAKDELLDTFPTINPSTIAVIPHGNYVDSYNQPPARDIARSSLAIPFDHITFLFLGFIRPYKGISDLISAFKAIAQKYPTTLIIAGKPATDALHRALVDQVRDEKNIHVFFDYIDEGEIPTFFAATDFYVLPYHHIVTSGAAILGMSFAKALIAPHLGCLPETLDENGSILFDPALESALQDALVLAIAKKADTVAMGKHNRSKVEQWNWQTIARMTLTLFQAIRAKN